MKGWMITLAAGLGIALPLLFAFSTPVPAKLPKGAADIRWIDFRLGEFDNIAEMQQIASEGRLDRPGNRLAFSQKDVHLWVEAHPPGRRESFLIAGLQNPEIQLVRGARLTVTLINLDYFSPAKFEITAQGPPFADLPINPDPWSRHLPFFRHDTGRLDSPVGPREARIVYSATLVFDVRSTGAAWYIANSVGDANIGNFGKITVIP